MGRGGHANDKVECGNAAFPLAMNVPTPSRNGRGDGSGNVRSRGPPSALEDIMRRKGVDEAWNALEEMQRQGVTADKYTVSRMIMKTVGDGRTRLDPPRIYRSISLVEQFIETQPKDVDEVLFNALLDTCCRLKDLNRLEALVKRMRELNVCPSPVTLGILVKTYGKAGDFQKVLQVWQEMEQQRSQANAVTYGCMIDACVKCGHLEKAVEIFAGMRKEGKHKNTVLYTTLIRGYGLEKDLAKALELFREMPQEGVPYNTITYNSIVEACVKNGDLSTAESLLREMTAQHSSLQPDLITFSTLLKGYCQIGELDKALQVMEAIKARGLRCDELVFNTLMDGCVKANDVSLGVGLFEEMVQSGLRPSAITSGILTRLYQRAGTEQDAQEAVAQLYQHHGIERPAGCDRGKGASKRWNQRSPGSRSAGDRTPLGSPSAGFSSLSERINNNCGEGAGNWGRMPALPGFDRPSALLSPSAPSTPADSSPQASSVHSGYGSSGMPFLPSEAMQGFFVPPMPGIAGPDGSPCSQATFASASAMGSPYMCSPYATSSPHGGAMHFGIGAAGAPQQQAQLPPWPFSCSGGGQYAATNGFGMGSMPPPPPNYPPGGDAMQQVIAVRMMQAHMTGNTCGAAGNAFGVADMSQTSFCSTGFEGQQSPFTMPLSSPHDLAYGHQGQMGPQQQQSSVFFESWPATPSGQP